MDLSRKEIGNLGEKIACRYLQKNHYIIKIKNYQKLVGEIDIIARSPKNILVFFEIKTRTSHKYGSGAESVNKAKQEKLVKTAYTYLHENKIENQKFRIDVISIDLDIKNRRSRVTHYRNAVGE